MTSPTRFAVLAVLVAASPSFAGEVKIEKLVVAQTLPAAQEKSELKAAKAFYQFWNTGDAAQLTSILSPAFVDHALPAGRPQGPAGPAYASEHFRAAVPDLTVEVRLMVLANDYVTVHMEFKGHFTGAFGKTKGNGQAVHFIATDLLKITDGRITDNWHIEDNLTLLSQFGVAKVQP